MLFDQYISGDSAPCFYCEKTLTWDEMSLTAWGDPYRENVCAPCRDEEVSNGGWMLRDPVSIKERQERPYVVISNLTDSQPLLPVRATDGGADLRLIEDGLPLDEFWIADDDGPRTIRAKARDALRGLRRARRLSAGA